MAVLSILGRRDLNLRGRGCRPQQKKEGQTGRRGRGKLISTFNRNGKVRWGHQNSSLGTNALWDPSPPKKRGGGTEGCKPGRLGKGERK